MLLVKKIAEKLEPLFSVEEKKIINKEYTTLGEEIKEVINEYKKLMLQ